MKPKGIKRKKDRREEEQDHPARGKIVTFLAIGLLMIGGVGAYSMMKGGSKAPEDGKDLNLPSYAYTSAESLRGYRIALRIPDILEQIPCYCGCGEMEHLSVKHRNLRDCFIFDDGTFDDHASYCDVCLYIALDVDKWQGQGLSVKEIRAKVDAKYGDGRFGPATKTPPIV